MVFADTAQDRGFTGGEFDDGKGLYYYRARHYDPALGRFLQSDPLGFAAGDLEAWGHNAGRTPTKSTKKSVLERDGCKCRYCGTNLVPGAGSPNSLEFDHHIPHAAGGGRNSDNIVCSCRTCNRGFGSKLPGKGKPKLKVD
ncbi:RHS repeat-associated core domain-containing protein [Tateyamaria sp. SN3-11]|uniref:RHS repeat-associated core domain-containing protein n=1 Tax=Tateyamaria sp. SN3-11 TaxID=3092147 RepID=UPI0039EC389D